MNKRADISMPDYSAAEIRVLAPDRLICDAGIPPAGAPAPGDHGDHRLNPELATFVTDVERRPAAVLVPIIDHGGHSTVLLTRRADDLPAHAGQVAFPGGKIEEEDGGAAVAALREAREEINLEPEYVQIVGYLDAYHTATGFCVMPVVAIVAPGFSLRPDRREVAEIFEVPLDFLMNPSNHHKHGIVWRGRRRQYYAMPYGEHYIWGATAGILRNLYERLYATC